MKKLLKNLSLVMLIPLVYFICATGFNDFKEAGKYTNTTTTPAYTFTNTIFNTGFNVMAYFPWLILTKNLEKYNELNFNAVHWYDWAGSDNYGNINEPLTQNQKDNFIHAIDSVNEKGLLGFYERSFISNYCYGQRLIYEVKPYNDNSSVNYGFVYEQCMENTYIMDGDRTVLHTIQGVNNPGYLCKNINENLQHTDLFGFRSEDKGKWFLKPVMKIPSNTLPNTNVVRIDIMAFDNPDDNNIQIPVRSITITADNFLNKGVYNSDYLGLNPELATYGDYYDENEPYLSLGMTGVDWWNWDDKCHIDFRVYWYGECDVWFDQMIVDDSRANDLFDPSKQGGINYRIKQEVSAFANIPGNYCFFVDEVTNANISCMRYVFQQMREAVPNVKISMATTDNMHILSLKNDDLPYTVFIDSLHPSFIQHDVHKFEVWEGNLTTSSYALVLPNTIPITECDPMIPSDFFKPVDEYNSHLQGDALGYKHKEVGNNQQGSLIYEIYKVYDSKPAGTTDIKFIIQPQIQGLLTKKAGESNYMGGAREPTNEEIQVQAMLSIAHGASGLCWYIYGSGIYDYNSNQKTINGVDAIFPDEAKYNTTLYTYGLLDYNGIKRHHNCYNQDKWNYVSDMNGKIKNWTNVLNNANWDSGYSVHSEGANHNYINDIRSKVPYINGLNPCADFGGSSEYFDCIEERYWEEGFYKPKDQSDKSKYFLMVNRRCVPPTLSTVGEVRVLKIKFNTLPDFNNWILKDVNSGKQITFNRCGGSPS